MEIFMPRKRLWSPTYGRGRLLSPEGDVLAEDPDWIPNTLADEGEENILSVWLKETAHLTKYLGLLNDATIAETDTVATVTETTTPGTNGYARVQILAADWSTPALNAGDFQSTAAAKRFSPSATLTITAAFLTTTATGTTGKFLLWLATTITSIPSGTNYDYTLAVKAQ